METAFDRKAQQLGHGVRVLRLPPRGRATRAKAGMAQQPQSGHWPCSSALRDSQHEVTLPLGGAPSLQRVLAWDSQLLSFSSTVGIQRKCSLALPVF